MWPTAATYAGAQCPAEPQAQPQLIAWAPGEQVGAQPRRPCRRSQQPVSHDRRSHYSSLSCKQLSTALIRATEEHRELSPLRVRGCVSSWGVLCLLTGMAASRLAHLPGKVNPAGAWLAALPSPTRVPLQYLSAPWEQWVVGAGGGWGLSL